MQAKLQKKIAGRRQPNPSRLCERRERQSSERGRVMHAEAGLLLPFFEGFCLVPQSPPLPTRQLPNQQLALPLSGELPGVGTARLGNLVQPSTILEYDLGFEGDLFKAPEPIIEETLLTIDPVSAAMSIISGGDGVINNTIVADVQTIQNEIQNAHLLSDVFYECKKDLESYANGDAVREPTMECDEAPTVESGGGDALGQLQKCISAGCLNSVEWNNGGGRPNFLGFQGLDFEAAYGMRRAYSEGDIQKLGNANASFQNTNAVCSSLEQLLAMGDLKSEERRQKLSRYMKKKTKRNFGRKIKYACRKALADSQPRVRGRFARPEEYENSKQHK
ncbi:hypothetical protein HPP92_021502 [Vanilla planifolia]|uniref:CCT domain-containing protein n=1 Tax=Vanilla planifolia TaxID=51239 RepID=A0A835PYZ1_VANPL|nr:hypothetical protein HPP92_021502 [Vanilla planifolia]